MTIKPDILFSLLADGAGPVGRRGRPVAVDVHISSEQWPMVAADGDHEHRLDQIAQRVAFNLYREGLIATERLGGSAMAVEDFNTLGAQVRIALLVADIVHCVEIGPQDVRGGLDVGARRWLRGSASSSAALGTA